MPNKKLDADFLLNMQMIKDELEEDYNITYSFPWHDSQRLMGARIYYGQKELDPSQVYIATAEVFDKSPITTPEICQIVVGSLKSRPNLPHYSLIEVIGAKWEEVLNTVQGIFERYQAWSQRLLYILNSGGGLYELCVAALDFFQNPLYIHDENFNILAMPMWVVGMTQLLVDEHTGSATVPLEKIQQFKVNPAYIKTLTTHGAQLWNPSYNLHRVIYVNIWVGEQYCGRFLINELNSSFKPSQFTLAEYFVKILSMAFERNQFKSSTTLTFEKLLQQVYAGEAVDTTYLLDRLHMVGWNRQDRYCCFLLQMDKKPHEILSSRKISSTVGMYLKNSFSFPLEDRIYTVCNLTRSGYRARNCREIMLDVAQAADLWVGGSDAFDDFMELREYFRQAEKALKIGRASRPGTRYHPFPEYVLDYIIRHFTSEFHVRTICSKAILRLDEMDREKHTDYLNTLQCYFDNNCQQTATAKALFIHRSTLMYRLEKLQELTGVDLEDADTRLYLQISMKLLKTP